MMMMMIMFFKQVSNLFSWSWSFTLLSTYFCILFPHFYCSLISVSKKLDIERILTLPYSHKWQKLNKINERKSQGCQSVGAKYVTEQINSLTLSLFWDDFTTWFLYLLENLKAFKINIKPFPNDHKIYPSYLQESILLQMAPLKVYWTIYESLKNSYFQKSFRIIYKMCF